MANLTFRRRPTKLQRATHAAGQAGSATLTFLKARLAWAAGKKATKVAVPAAAAGTAAVVAKKRFSRGHATTPDEHAPSTTGVNAVPPTPAGVA